MKKPQSALADEIRQRKPFDSPRHEALLGLFRAADVLRRREAGVFEPTGITAQQYNVLRILRGAGKEGLPTLEIVDRMIEQTPGITRLLDRLEAKGLVQRSRCTEDRRQVICRISGGGRRLLATLDGPVRESGTAALAALSAAEVARLIPLLDKIRAGNAAGPRMKTAS